MRLRVASYESCRASRCTQATSESTLSPTHLMQQLLAFVHPLLKWNDPYKPPLVWMGKFLHQLVGGLSLLFMGFYPSQVVQDFVYPQYAFLYSTTFLPISHHQVIHDQDLLGMESWDLVAMEKADDSWHHHHGVSVYARNPFAPRNETIVETIVSCDLQGNHQAWVVYPWIVIMYGSLPFCESGLNHKGIYVWHRYCCITTVGYLQFIKHTCS